MAPPADPPPTKHAPAILRVAVAVNYVVYILACVRFVLRDRSLPAEQVAGDCKFAMMTFVVGLLAEAAMAGAFGWICYPKWPLSGLLQHHLINCASVSLGLLLSDADLVRLGDCGTVAWSCLQMNEVIMVSQTFSPSDSVFKTLGIARRGISVPFFVFASFYVLPMLSVEVLKAPSPFAILYWLPNAALVFHFYLPPRLGWPPVNTARSYIFKEIAFLRSVLAGEDASGKPATKKTT